MVDVDRSVRGENCSEPNPHIAIEGKPGDGLVVVRVRGDVDSDGSRKLDHFLRTRTPANCRAVVVDLGQVALLGASGVRVLIEHTDRLALAGRRLLTVASNPHVRRVLALLQVTQVVRIHESVSSAVAACAGQAPVSAPEPSPPTGGGSPAFVLADLRQEIFALRAALRVQPVIARALGVVQERYKLPDSSAAFDLLRDIAQPRNLRLYTVARRLLDAPRPDGEIWFPRRIRQPAPSLSFCHVPSERRGDRRAVLGAFLREVLKYMRTSMGAVLLAESHGCFRLEVSNGLSPDLVDHLSEVPDASLPTGSRAVVADIAADETIEGRDVLLNAGVAAMQGTPLSASSKGCLGVVVTYHSEPGFSPGPLQCAKLDHAATEIAIWLDWHARTVVLAALEEMHQAGRAASQ